MKIEMVWEWNWPHKMVGENTTSFFCVDFYHHKKGDHAPGWHFYLGIWNWMLLDFSYYNKHHEECGEDCEQ